MKPISTRTHGILDYASVIVLYLLSNMLGWNRRVKWLLRLSAAATLGYSLFTRYEFGVQRRLPMKTHLLLDGASGALLTLSPLLLRIHNPLINLILRGFGLFEVGAALSTQTESPLALDERPQPERAEFSIPVDVQAYVRSS